MSQCSWESFKTPQRRELAESVLKSIFIRYGVDSPDLLKHLVQLQAGTDAQIAWLYSFLNPSEFTWRQKAQECFKQLQYLDCYCEGDEECPVCGLWKAIGGTDV